jgi:metal-responsive CopG/Arc/MetJ family transcriptional regulator
MSRKKLSQDRVQIPVVFKLPREFLEEIDLYIKEHPREGNRSELIRTAIKRYIERNDRH